MKKYVLGFAIAMVAPLATAGTIAHWTFETDLIAGSAVAGQTVSHPSAGGLFDAAIPDISGNNNHLSAFTGGGGGFADMAFSGTVNPLSGTGSTLSIDRRRLPSSANFPGLFNNGTGYDGDLKVGGVDVGALNAWTVEASVNFTDAGGWQTMVGKDGEYEQFGFAPGGMTYLDSTTGGGIDGNVAPLYFQKIGDGTNRFRVLFTAVDGNIYGVSSITRAAANTWYNVAATSDGQFLKLFVNGVQEAALDMVAASGMTDKSLMAIQEAGGEGGGNAVPFSWSLMRGMYNDGHGDRVNGVMDDVRISNMALLPSEFLTIPEPMTVSLVGCGLLALAACKRRRA